MMPRVPSISCRSVTRLRSFSSELALEQRLALDHDEHVEFARREALRHLLVLPEFRRVGAEQLAERIVDLDARDAEPRGDARTPATISVTSERKAQRDEADPLEPERDAMRVVLG